jgi:uncharacterized membrane protein YagU involved in acid resistance
VIAGTVREADMTDSGVFWLGMVLYAVVLMGFLYMTRKEQAVNHVPWSGAIVGFLGCLVWPITMAVVALVILLRGREGRRSD